MRSNLIFSLITLKQRRPNDYFLSTKPVKFCHSAEIPPRFITSQIYSRTRILLLKAHLGIIKIRFSHLALILLLINPRIQAIFASPLLPFTKHIEIKSFSSKL